MSESKEYIEVYGAREHNLKNIDVKIPRNELVVITGLSGSGKSSLAFDTIFAEGQRRYIETFSAYARQFLGGLERPDVDKIEGLSPVIAIEQKTTNKNPRSTVGTVTELYDYLRLLFARVSDAYSQTTGKKMVSYTEDQILNTIKQNYKGEKIMLMAPVVRSRKGHYHELFVQMAKKGYGQARIDGELQDIEYDLKLDRYKTHDIDIVIDRWIIGESASETRMEKSLRTAMEMGEGLIGIQKLGSTEIEYFSKNLMDDATGHSLALPEPNTFSFNSPKGSCPSCKGLGTIKKINTDHFVENPKLSINQGGLLPLEDIKSNKYILSQIKNILEIFGLGLATPFKDIPDEALDYIYHGCHKEFNKDLKYAGITKKIKISFDGLIPFMEELIEERESYEAILLERHFTTEETCPDCKGARLQPSSLSFKIDGKNIAEINGLSLSDLKDWLRDVKDKFSEKNGIIAHEILKEIETRLQFLLDVGLEYLSLSRSSKTLSGGESQRIRLATQIGSQLVNVLYILDEPSIGLHQSDNERLINSLKNLRDIGNSVIVVEHDKDMIMEADEVLDIGPRAGKFGGEILWQGKPADLLKADTITADYINGKRKIAIPEVRREGNGKSIVLKGATGNNLKNVTLDIPLGKLVVVTGISGSGKSSLINGTLYPILNKHFYRAVQEPLPYKKIDGLDNIDKIVDVDQTPIGRTPRSNPATYTGMFTDIRNLFSELPESKIRGYKPGRFSFNVKGGRCETCQGGGLKVIEMNFLPDVYVHCETCNGKRFNRETLEVRYKGKSISDVLDMTIDEAVDFFQPIPKIFARVKTLQDVGLGYITMGQQSTTLSGGEAQRIKLATELAKRQTGNTLYILDEPTTGLHFEDVKILMDAINKLVELGNSFIIIEHNMDVIKLADHIIDVGPEGGKYGGEIIAKGTPEEIIKSKKIFNREIPKEGNVIQNSNYKKEFVKADSFYFYENNDEMKKPKEIIALEKLYNIQLQQTFYKDDILNVDRNNLFLLDKKENVLGLNLSGNKIDEIKGFEDVKEVLYLNFYNNSLKVIENLQHLRKLEILILSNNKIVKLNEISNPNLKILNLTSNQITKIIGLEKLKNLQEIYFTLNHIKEIKNFENLRNLKVLKIDFNDLAALDFKAFCNCNLKYLDLRNNWINKLMNLEFVKEIEHLNLKYNHINEVQIIKEILNFKNLNYINVEGNPFLNNTNLELRGYGYENHVDDLRQYFHSQC